MTSYVRRLFDRTPLVGMRCDNCQAVDTTGRRRVIARAPQQLLLALVRFTQNPQTGGFMKNTDEVNFSNLLHLTSFHKTKSTITYKLSAVIHHTHLGRGSRSNHGGPSMNSGHYKAVVQNPVGYWTELNDEIISWPVSWPAVHNPGGNWTPYIFMYDRIA